MAIREGKARDEIYLETGGQRAIRARDWKLIESIAGKTRLELYNLKHDPMEIENLADKEEKVKKELQEKLTKWVRSNLEEGENDPFFSLGIPQELLLANSTCYIGSLVRGRPGL